jgi:hypothetical protein
MPLAKQDITLGNITYELSVRAGDGEIERFFGAFFCGKCHQGWIKYDLKPTIAEAFDDARDRANLHQLEFHSDESTVEELGED